METVLEKGYSIDLGRIDEGFLYSEHSCTAVSRSEAKTKLLRKIRFDDMKLRYCGSEVTYLNIPVVRNKDQDLILFEEKPVKRSEVDYILLKRKRAAYFQSIMDDPNVSHCYIVKAGSYYRPNACGYTQVITKAGVYEKAEAVEHGLSCGDLRIVPIVTEEHNTALQKEIDEMKSRILPIKQ